MEKQDPYQPPKVPQPIPPAPPMWHRIKRGIRFNKYVFFTAIAISVGLLVTGYARLPLGEILVLGCGWLMAFNVLFYFVLLVMAFVDAYRETETRLPPKE